MPVMDQRLALGAGAPHIAPPGPPPAKAPQTPPPPSPLPPRPKGASSQQSAGGCRWRPELRSPPPRACLIAMFGLATATSVSGTAYRMMPLITATHALWQQRRQVFLHQINRASQH